MSSMAATLTKQLGSLTRSAAARSSRALGSSATRPPQGNMGEDAQKSAKEEVPSGDKMGQEGRGLSSAGASAAIKVEEFEEETEEFTEKSKQMAQNAWGRAKQTGQKVKDTIFSKAEHAKETVFAKAEGAKETVYTKAEGAKETVASKTEGTKETIKENADAVKRAMDSKNRH